MKEIWKDIPNYEGLYQASNLGRIKSLWYGKEKILKLTDNGNGYLQVFLCKNGIRKIFLVHRLIALTFIPNPNNLPEVNHRNEIKNCNLVDNLEWCTSFYNTRYSQNKKVLQYDLNGNFIREWDCAKDVKRILNIDNSGVSCSCNGKRKTAGGYIWRYADE